MAGDVRLRARHCSIMRLIHSHLVQQKFEEGKEEDPVDQIAGRSQQQHQVRMAYFHASHAIRVIYPAQ